MNDLVKVATVRHLGGYRLLVAFSDGSRGIRDFADVVAAGGEMIAPLRDEALFARAFVEMGVLAWPHGLDFDAIALHDGMREAGLLDREAA